MMPKMIEQGYPTPFVVVLAASAALLEALIPPSNAAILYSALTNVPVSQTFAAGIIPGYYPCSESLRYWNISESTIKYCCVGWRD